MPDAVQVTFDKLKKMFEALAAHEASMKKGFEDARKGLRTAVDHESEDEIHLTRPDLDEALEKVDEGLDACERIHLDTVEILKHPEFVATHKPELTRMVSYVAKQKKQLSDWAREGRKLQQESDQVAGSAHKGARETDTELASLKNRARLIGTDIAACKSQFPKLEKTARDATGKNDDKTAEKARLQMLDLMAQPKRRTMELRPLLKHFQDEHTGTDRAMKAELQQVVDALQDAEDTLQDGMKTFNDLIKLKQQVLAGSAKAKEPVDVPRGELLKVATLVGIDPKDGKALSALAKVLDTPHDKWADGLAKLATQLKLKNTNGRNMVAAIDKLPFFKASFAGP